MDTATYPPTLLIIFNRPDKVRLLIEALSRVRPSRIYISADGPRTTIAGEKEKCAEARRIAQDISWPCEIHTNFLDNNLGCKQGVSSGISWFFTQVEEGIILEDDCIPVPSFFPFCRELLDRYRNNEQIMHIGGTTFLSQEEVSDPSASYHFSRITHIWGWATWRRAWQTYDIKMENIDLLAQSPQTKNAFIAKKYLQFWIDLFRHVRDKHIDTWDAQWMYSVLAHGGLSIAPHVSLIENIGFGKDATHTHSDNPHALKATDIALPLSHPRIITPDQYADRKLMRKVYLRNIWQKIISRIK